MFFFGNFQNNVLTDEGFENSLQIKDNSFIVYCEL